jgi:hypothetical protein
MSIKTGELISMPTLSIDAEKVRLHMEKELEKEFVEQAGRMARSEAMKLMRSNGFYGEPAGAGFLLMKQIAEEYVKSEKFSALIVEALGRHAEQAADEAARTLLRSKSRKLLFAKEGA